MILLGLRSFISSMTFEQYVLIKLENLISPESTVKLSIPKTYYMYIRSIQTAIDCSFTSSLEIFLSPTSAVTVDNLRIENTVIDPFHISSLISSWISFRLIFLWFLLNLLMQDLVTWKINRTNVQCIEYFNVNIYTPTKDRWYSMKDDK